MNFRPERAGSLLREELAKIILREIEVPGAVITLTEFEVSKDLTESKVKISVLPSDKSEAALKILEARLPYLRFLLMKQVHIKPMPRLVFMIDHGPERAAGIEKALLKDNNR